MDNLLPYLKITSPSGDKKILPLTKTKYTIGRLPENDVSLPEQKGFITRIEHCLLQRKNNRWYLKDNSENGTIVQHEEEQFQLQELPDKTSIINTEDKIIIYKWILEYIDPHKTNNQRLEHINRPKTPLVFNVTQSCLYAIEQKQRQIINFPTGQIEDMLQCMAKKKLRQGKQCICTYKELNQAIWHEDKALEKHDIYNLAKTIRNIFEENGGDRNWLITVRNKGLILKIDCEG